jgi:hypothetical protein
LKKEPVTLHAPISAALLPKGKWLRYRRLPTWRLWLILLAAVVLPLAYLGYRSHDWLSRHDPLPDATYYVAEGWMPDYALLEAARYFEDDDADLLLTSGLRLERGMLLCEFKDHATLAGATLAKSGVAAQKILPCPAEPSKRERTLAMALAVKQQLETLNVPLDRRRLNLVSHGPHARRSASVYQTVLGESWQVGVICVPSQDYPLDGWYKTSEGIKRVAVELMALVGNRADPNSDPSAAAPSAAPLPQMPSGHP